MAISKVLRESWRGTLLLRHFLKPLQRTSRPRAAEATAG